MNGLLYACLLIYELDQKKVSEVLGWSKGKTRMATIEEVMEKTGCEIGAVPPLGHRNEIQIIVDKRVYQNEDSVFNIGLRTNSVKVKTLDMKKVFTGCLECDFSK